MNDRGRARTRVSARHRKIAEELQFATWLGWLLAPDSLVVPLRNPHQDPAEIAWQALKIGYGLAGELDGGMPAWVAAGQPIAATALVTPGAIQDRRMIDVRQRGEFRSGHVPDAMHIELGALATTADRLPARRTVAMYGHGERAAGAASLLEPTGHHDLAVLVGRPDDWAATTGRRLRTD